MYYSEALTHRRYQMPAFFPTAKAETKIITFLSIISAWPLSVLATNRVFDYCLLKQGNGATQSVGYWTYDKTGQRRENITDWALDKFRRNYATSSSKKAQLITKEAIFHYVYAVLHDPVYREKYAMHVSAGTHIGTLCEAIHLQPGEVGVRRILGGLSLAKKCGTAAAERFSTRFGPTRALRRSFAR
jgi:predicted helicase